MIQQRTDYSVPEAAQLMHCSPQTVTRMIVSGRLKAYRVGGDGHYRIPWAELDRVRSAWIVPADVSTAI